MNENNFPFESFSLILSRDCNLSCNYCPLEHKDKHITNDVLDSFFQKIATYHKKNINLILFG
jgi:sulfatase maturation enzyme AslB (radical SAM superfamily)